MPIVALTDRAIVEINGADAHDFAQNIITTDLDSMKDGEARAGALLAPQGKILFDFVVSKAGPETIRLDCRADVVDDFVRRLSMYKLRAKVTISKRDQQLVLVTWDDDSSGSESDSTIVRDTRFRGGPDVRRYYGAAASAADVDPAAWTALKIEHGVAESGSDYALGDAFPHDVLLDQIEGVGFHKGCYIGQEVVSRMQHRGTARRRVLIATASGQLPPVGTDIKADGRVIGALGSVSGSRGLAIARIDKVKAAMDAGISIEAEGVVLTLAIPTWAGFAFPQEASAEDA